MKCPSCNFVWTRLDICPTLPIHDCTKFDGKNPTIRELILDYLKDYPRSTYDEVCSGLGKNCSGSMAKVEYHIACMVAVGEVKKEGDPEVYSLVP